MILKRNLGNFFKWKLKIFLIKLIKKSESQLIIKKILAMYLYLLMLNKIYTLLKFNLTLENNF